MSPDMLSRTPLQTLLVRPKTLKYGASKCPECRSPQIVHRESQGDAICRGCGLVCAARIPVVPRDSSYIVDGNVRKLGLDDSSGFLRRHGLLQEEFSTSINCNGAKAASTLSSVHSKCLGSGKRDQRLVRAVQVLQACCERLQLTGNIVGSAVVIYSRALDSEIRTYGRYVSEVVAATVYAACRVCAVPRTLREICKVVLEPNADGADLTIAGRVYSKLKRTLKLSIVPIHIVVFTRRFTSILGLPRAIIRAAEDIANRLDAVSDVVSFSRSTATVAAAISVFASALSLSPIQPSAAADALLIPVDGLRSTLDGMMSKKTLDLLLPHSILEKLELDGLDVRRLQNYSIKSVKNKNENILTRRKIPSTKSKSSKSSSTKSKSSKSSSTKSKSLKSLSKKSKSSKSSSKKSKSLKSSSKKSKIDKKRKTSKKGKRKLDPKSDESNAREKKKKKIKKSSKKSKTKVTMKRKKSKII